MGEARHPLLERTSKLITGDFVTADTGTGAVHIAPGHGMDDYIAGQANKLGMLSPVDDAGLFTAECGIPELTGMHVFKANGRIVEMLAEAGVLLGKEDYVHSYPHCWRSKTPVLFRALEQFFIRIDGIRPQALDEIDKVEWVPAWGRKPDQRHGGIPARLVHLAPAHVGRAAAGVL